MIKELSKRTYNKKRRDNEAPNNNLKMSTSFDLFIKNTES